MTEKLAKTLGKTISLSIHILIGNESESHAKTSRICHLLTVQEVEIQAISNKISL